MCETEAKALPPKSSGGKEKAKSGDNKGKGDSKAKKVEKAKAEPKAEPKPEKMEVGNYIFYFKHYIYIITKNKDKSCLLLQG